MKKQVVGVMWSMGIGVMLLVPTNKAEAQIIDIVSQALVKVVNAIDIKVQQLQNQTIWLQNAEKELENKMALGNLNDISGWLGKEKDLYAQYYQELQTVRGVIADYDEVKRIASQQTQLVNEYKTAYNLFRQDAHFSTDEISRMQQVYQGILDESVRNLDEVLLAVNSFQTQMTDGERLELIHTAGTKIQRNLNDLRQFNTANLRLSQQRAKADNDNNTLRSLYGLPKN